ncbi:MAG: hypothetical protein M1299_11150 [Firmicutes bacterium]|nr:hypothetical protein [Bacillota bacterium]
MKVVRRVAQNYVQQLRTHVTDLRVKVVRRGQGHNYDRPSVGGYRPEIERAMPPRETTASVWP